MTFNDRIGEAATVPSVVQIVSEYMWQLDESARMALPQDCRSTHYADSVDVAAISVCLSIHARELQEDGQRVPLEHELAMSFFERAVARLRVIAQMEKLQESQ